MLICQDSFHIIEKENKKFYFIQIDDLQCGFFAIFRYLLEYLYISDKLEMIPIIDIKNSLYKEEEKIGGTNNPYEYYFEQPSNLKVEDVQSLSNICYSNPRDRELVSIALTGESATYKITEDYMKKMALILHKYIKLNVPTQKYINDSVRNTIGNKRVLGVHIRGTDFKVGYTNHPIYVPLQAYINVIDQQIKYNDWDKIFLATDDSNVLQQLINRYGDKLIYYNSYRGESNVSIAFSDNKRDKHKYNLGLEVLRDAYTLAFCQGLVCGVSQVAICSRIIKKSIGQEYDYIEIIKSGIKKEGLSFIGNATQYKEEATESSQDNIQKLREFYCILNQWIYIHHQRKSLVEYFEKHNYRNIAIYGMKELGKNLCDELMDSDISVDYVIDMNKKNTYKSLKLYRPDDNLPQIDIIVITAIHYYKDIKRKLEDKVKCPIISLESIIKELM